MLAKELHSFNWENNIFAMESFVPVIDSSVSPGDLGSQ